ncbi:MAG TPA: DUF2333 family protein [Mariprofundaceae bacterium]|nr:DUF2333 family protein [Mariprofundaceae bacterium]
MYESFKQRLNQIKEMLPGLAALVGAVVLIMLLSLWGYAGSRQSEPFKAQLNGIEGTNFVEVNRELTRIELDSFTGWTPNDYLPLTAFLDNKQNFQLGVIETVRFSVRVLRDNLSRQRTTDQIDDDVKKAFEFYSNDPNKWIFPSYEGRLKEASQALQSYTERLKSGKARFHPRSDNLIQLLEQYSSLLGSATTSLTDESLGWMETDDRFFYSKGVAYAMYVEMQAVQKDFHEVLKKNDGEELTAAIIRELRDTWFEPTVVLNGSKDGIYANHLKNLASDLLGIRQKLNSLSSVLSHRGSSSAG